MKRIVFLVVIALVLGTSAQKRKFTTIGIKTFDGHDYVFAIQGKSPMEYVMAIEDLATKVEE